MNKIFECLDSIMFINVCDLCQTQKISNKVVKKAPVIFKFVHNHFKAQVMCQRAVERFFYAFSYFSDQGKTQQTRESVALKDPENLQFVSNHFKTNQICGIAFKIHIFLISEKPNRCGKN